MTEISPATGKTWFMIAGALVVGLALFAAVMAFVVTPLSQAGSLGLSPWVAVCRAFGLSQTPPPTRGGYLVGTTPVSAVVFDRGLIERLAHADRREGARTVAETCAVCHGAEGVSENPAFPSLADQSAAAIYKQLSDYKTNARINPVMSAVVLPLTDARMFNVAAYLAHDNGFAGLGPRWPVPDPEIIALVRDGDPGRTLPACESCHGVNAGGPIETPRLYGQKQAYLLAQLQAYGSGARRNDVYGRMRSVAQKLTPNEMTRLAAYYQGLR